MAQRQIRWSLVAAGLAALLAPPLWASSITLEAETMPTKTTGGPTAGGWCLWANGYIEQTVAFSTTGTYRFDIVARGQPALGVWPTLQLRRDQVTVGTTTVNASGWAVSTLTASITAGSRKIAVAFTNDYYAPPEDRNLYVDKVVITPPGAPPPVIDLTAPVLTAVTVTNVTAAGATITWTTDEPATSQVGYGLTDDYGQESALDAALVTQHSVALSGLAPGTLYHVIAISEDAAGNVGESADATFATLSASADTTPPQISAVASSGVTAAGATITWTTDEPATSQVEYGPTTAYGSSTPFDAALVTSHSVALTGLAAGSLYHYRVRSKDAAGNEAASAGATFTTAPPPDTTPPVITFTSPTDGQILVAP